jgi:lipopolysaccharide export system permease protein
VRLLRSYILRLHLVPFLLGFGVITFLLVMDTIFDYLDLIVNRGLPVTTVLELFALSLGFIVALSAPCGVLVAALMTFGRLSQDNEITALRASGVNLWSVLVGPLAASFALALMLVAFNNWVLPETNHAFANLLVDIGRMRPTVRLQEGVFINDFPGYDLLVRSVNGRTNEMRGVTIYQMNPGGPPTTIIAKRGRLSYTPDGRTVVLELKDGEIHFIPPDNDGGSRRYRRLEFKTHVINIPGAGGMLERTVRDVRGNREMTATMLLAQRDTTRRQLEAAAAGRLDHLRELGILDAELTELHPGHAAASAGMIAQIGALIGRHEKLDQVADQHPELRSEIELWRLERDAYLKRMANLSVEVHKKFALPFACVVFVMIGAPIGMRVRRTGPAVAFLSVLFFMFYWLCLIGGEELANRLLMPPWLGMWLPNIVLGALGVQWMLEACEVRTPWSRRAVYRRAPRGATAVAT